MIREAINRILDLAPVEYREEHGLTYVSKAMNYLVEPSSEPLRFNTLTGFISCVVSSIYESNEFIQVINHENVALNGPQKTDKTFDGLATASCSLYSEGFKFSRWMSQDTFMIALMSKFVMTPDLEYLIKKAGTASSSSSVKTVDDGMTQQVECKQNVAISESVELKRVVKLRPYRTFREIEQPESTFLFRVRKDGDDLEFALFEADGSAWKLDAIKRIEAFLQAGIKDVKKPMPVLA